MRSPGSLDATWAASRAARPELVEVLRSALAAGPLELVAQGWSMRPALRPGDRVRLEARAPRWGEIVLAIAGKRLVLHRALRSRGGAWFLRGDARRYADGWVFARDILGVATARGRGGLRAPRWKRLDGGAARVHGLIAAGIAGIARRMRERIDVRRRRRHPVSRSSSAPPRRARGSPDDGHDRTRSATQAPQAGR